MGDDEQSETTHDDELRVAGVGLHKIGERLIELGDLLVQAGRHTDNDALRKNFETADLVGDQEVYEAADKAARSAIRRTLTDLNTFRREYGDWERLTVEYALTREGFTQREVASLLGVGLSTVNRWAQHPLTYPED